VTSRGAPVLFLLLILVALPPSADAQTSGTTAFRGVSVLPMDRERILEDHTVLVREGVIREVAPSHRVSLPEDARIIEGEGLFLLPALGDMLIRLPGREAPEGLVGDLLFLYLANNVTAARVLDGGLEHLRLKRRIQQGDVLGPTLYVAAPPFDSATAAHPDTLIARLMAHRSTGYEFQEIRGNIPRHSWDSMTEAAHSRGYTFGGRIPDSVGIRHALSTGISVIDHLNGYLPEVVPPEVKARMEDEEDPLPLRQVLTAVEGRRMRAMAAHTRAADTWVVPTLRLWENRYRPLAPDSLLALPEMAYVPEAMKEEWVGEKARGPSVDEETARLLTDARRQLVRAITMAGVGVLLGSDSPSLFNVPGFALRHEMESTRAAGLTPYEVLVLATRNVAEYARRELLEAGNFGRVEVGNRADLVLLRGNPFRDLDHLWDQEGVMVRGRWMSREEIDAGLARLAEKYGAPAGESRKP
jgi:hypothetical protein